MQYYPQTNKSIVFDSDKTLTQLANLLETDKGDAETSSLSWSKAFPEHFTNGYTNTYEKYMSAHRESPINFLEIGICDQRFPLASVKMWLSYFKNINLYCIDNFWGHTINSQICSEVQNFGANLFVADQNSEADWDGIDTIIPSNSIDFIVEDGSHYPQHMLYTLWRSIKLLKTNAYYFMEDIQDPFTMGSKYGFDNTCIYNIVNNFMLQNTFDTNILNEQQKLDIMHNYRVVEIHTGGPKHCQALMAVFQKVV